jgi:hypothetical protein
MTRAADRRLEPARFSMLSAIRREGERLKSRWGGPAARLLRWAMLVALVGFLVQGLATLGWGRVWDARPTAASFYLVQLLPFLILPVSELVIYRNLLSAGRQLPLFVLLRKRYLNNAMLEYSGEAYFFFWVQKNIAVTRTKLLHAVRDSNVLSAGAALLMVWVIFAALVAAGGFELPAFVVSNRWTLISAGSLPLALSVALLAAGRRVTSLTRPQIVSTFAIHLARSAAVLALEFLTWWLSGALPSAAACLAFVAFRLVLTRLPLVPSKDLLFVGLGIAAAGLTDLSQPKVAATLVIMTGFQQILDVLLVGFPWFASDFRIRRNPRIAAP